MSAPVPSQAWIKAVCDCLISADRKRIVLRQRASLDWSALFPDAFLSDLYLALAKALKSTDLDAKRVDDMKEPGETYGFFFYYRSQKLFGKICLQPDGKMIIVYSAHRPLRPSL